MPKSTAVWFAAFRDHKPRFLLRDLLEKGAELGSRNVCRKGTILRVYSGTITCFLSRPLMDYGGGKFLIVEHLPRTQSRGEAITAEQGELVIFANSERPVPGRRGY